MSSALWVLRAVWQRNKKNDYVSAMQYLEPRMRFPVTNRRLALLKSVGVYRSLERLPSMLVPASAAHGAACRRCERHMYAV